jgi:hypothetical protein
MRTSCVKNGLAVGVILLFVGIAVQPVIIADVTIESDNSELVEITVEICEVGKAYNHSVMLTQEKAKELENLINNFEIELDGADSIAETEIIFKDTVVSLNELGLLPECMSVQEAQRLVTGEEQNPRVVKLIERYYSKNQKSLDNDKNILCLISGHTNVTFFLGPTGSILMLLFMFLPEPFRSFILPIFTVYGPFFWNFNPLPFGYIIGLGADGYYPANGMVNTIGLSGIKKWGGSFYGHLPLPQFISLLCSCYPGVLGFTGIRIPSAPFPIKSTFYFGTALWVKIGVELP